MPENNNMPQTQQPQYIYIKSPYDEDEEDEIDLFELCGAVWKKKWRIFFCMVLGTALALGYALSLPFIYKSEARIMPAGGSGGGGGRLAGLVAQYGGLASMMGISVPEGSGGSGALMIDIMKSDTIVDAVIDKFNLMEENEWEYRKFARKAMLTNFETETDTKGSGIITVSFKDKDPQRAADIVNAFIDELRKKMIEMSLNTAKEKRTFYETQLIEVQQELADAEEAMMKYQQKSGVIVIEEQAKKLIDAMATLRTEIAAKKVEVSTLSSYARKDNPQLKLAQSQLAAMQKELKNLEEEQKRSSARTSSGDIMLSVGEIPELAVEYQRYMRALKVAGAKYEFMFSQYESARLGEISDLSTITIIDPATPPDYKDGPSRANITIIGCVIGGFLPTGWTAGKFVINEAKKSRKKRKDDDDDEDDYDDD